MVPSPHEMQEINRKLIVEFRENGRKLPGRAILLLTTVGARTGQRRTTPMMFVRLDGRLLVIASNAGAPKHPDWYRNLVANPAVNVEADGAEYAATATPATGADRDELFARIVAQYPFFADHQNGIDRTIPVVELTPVESS
jgi:deazaflavin-dependent oxidoreductase (nitroreductase family)